MLRIDLPPAKARALARLADVYECDVHELACLAVVEMLKAHRRPRRRVRKQTSAKRRPAARRQPVARQASATKPQQPTAPVVVPAPAQRVYQPKRCPACGKDFTPSGPRSITCNRCRAEFAASPSLNDADYPQRPGARLQ